MPHLLVHVSCYRVALTAVPSHGSLRLNNMLQATEEATQSPAKLKGKVGVCRIYLRGKSGAFQIFSQTSYSLIKRD